MRPERLALRHALDAVLAVGERGLDAEEEHHLGEGDGDHGEINADAADGERAGDEAERGGSGDAERDRRHRLQSPYLGRVGADIGGKAEEHRVPERKQVGVAEQEIERAGEQREA